MGSEVGTWRETGVPGALCPSGWELLVWWVRSGKVLGPCSYDLCLFYRSAGLQPKSTPEEHEPPPEGKQILKRYGHYQQQADGAVGWHGNKANLAMGSCPVSTQMLSRSSVLPARLEAKVWSGHRRCVLVGGLGCRPPP